MSLANKDRKSQSKSGMILPPTNGTRMGSSAFAAAIANALHREFGNAGAAVKTIAGLTKANERAVKNWYQGRNGPSGEFLVLLCQHSNHVLETVLLLAGRTDLVMTKTLIEAKRKLREMLAIIDELD